MPLVLFETDQEYRLELYPVDRWPTTGFRVPPWAFDKREFDSVAIFVRQGFEAKTHDWQLSMALGCTYSIRIR
jgi:hypothetical protein